MYVLYGFCIMQQWTGKYMAHLGLVRPGIMSVWLSPKIPGLSKLPVT